ncbi:hypothetical protein ONS95_000163 [Cadophora gregata]|uniref:uncharacterized protein n=1 Tax=Cadophora gregata TaxID=51156 RepID=UPI0026DAEA52|nr:uncharacterized protein ONS95_000163 [Cadophora gregata]KAK0115561.1 hypothetical protein ONS96_014015 [Cadophora gregata f. sp. sojae]KAK0128184.1 hypothetical protein ONS95_000163 [Cadophora gregata]
MANFASDHWQQIYIGDSADGGQSASGTSLYNNSLTGAIFFTETNTTKAQQLWQLYPFNSTYYVLRSKDSGPLGYLTVKFQANEDTPGKTVPLMTNASIADSSMFWQIQPWGDGTFFMTNAANGTAWHLEKKRNSLMAMSSNITAPQDGQRFSFKQLGQIQNTNYATVITPTGTSTPLPSNSITSSPAPTSSSSSGLSTGAKAGIGAGVGVAALAALLILGFFLLKRRKRAAQSSMQEPTPPYEPVSQQTYETEGKPLHNERPGELDAPVAHPAELNSDNTQQAAELPTWNGR